MKLFISEFLKIFTVICVVTLVGVLIYCLAHKVETAPVWSALSMIFGYWFGSSKGSADKTGIINQMHQDSTGSGGTP
jgi:uncharacterized membrane protein